MSFQIFEQGRRIETPWQNSFPARQVNSLEKSARVAPVAGEQSPVDQPSSDTNESATLEYERQQSLSDAEEARSRIYRADQIMVSPVVTLSPAASLDEAWTAFEAHSIRHLPVIDERAQILGVVSQRHLLSMTSVLAGPAMARSSSGLKQTPMGSTAVGDLMQSRVLTATRDTNLRELTKVMLERRVGSIMIISDVDQTLDGIITRSDVLKAVSNQVALELWA